VQGDNGIGVVDASGDNGCRYNVDWILGGRMTGLRREDLVYTTATMEGMMDHSEVDSGGKTGGRGCSSRKRQRPELMDPTPELRRKKAPADSALTANAGQIHSCCRCSCKKRQDCCQEKICHVA
jgi:hypothetical protein